MLTFFIELKSESTDKPGSVVDSHSSGTDVTACLLRPTRFQRGTRQWKPIWSCSEWGLPCHCCYQQRGALLPHPFTLTCIRERIIGGLLSAALSVGFRPPGVTWHSTLWSPDFPLACPPLNACEYRRIQSSDCLVNSLESLPHNLAQLDSTFNQLSN